MNGTNKVKKKHMIMRASSSGKNGLLVGGVCGALVFLAWAGQAAEGAKQAPVATVVEPVGPRVSLDIRDGVFQSGGRTATVGNIVKQVQAQVPDGNFVLSPGVSEVVVSNLVLRNANLLGVMTALGYASGNKVRASEVSPGVYAVIGGAVERKNKAVEAYNLSATLDRIGPRDSKAVRDWIAEINGLITTTLKAYDSRTDQQRDAPLLNFNDNTGMLVIIGQPEQLEITGKIVKALTQTGQGRRGFPAEENLLRQTKEESTKPQTTATPAETER